jgi:hypothetical protein
VTLYVYVPIGTDASVHDVPAIVVVGLVLHAAVVTLLELVRVA